MLWTRALVGGILAALMLGVLFVDDHFAPWYPFLLMTVAFLGGASMVELLRMIPEARRPPSWLCELGILMTIAANWFPADDTRIVDWLPTVNHWSAILACIVCVLLLAFLRELAI